MPSVVMAAPSEVHAGSSLILCSCALVLAACQRQMTSSVEALIQLYAQVIAAASGSQATPGASAGGSSFSLDPEDQLQVVEAVW